AVDALHEHRKNMRAEGRDVLFGQVFTDTEGGFLRKSNVVRRSFHTIIRKANQPGDADATEPGREPRAHLPQIRFHDLRHSAATLMLLLGTQPKVVAERLGHAKMDLVNNTYGHTLPSMQRESAEKLDKLLG